MLTVLLITHITTIIPSVTDGSDQSAVFVGALELALLADPLWAGGWLIRAIHAIHRAITLPVVWNALLICTSAPMLTPCAGSNARALICSQDKVIRARAGLPHSIKIIWCNETQVRAAAIQDGARVVVGNLTQRMIDVNVIGPVSGVP